MNNNIKIITVKDNFNKNLYKMYLSKVKGRNYLIKKGWVICRNKHYYTNNINTGHYNKYTKCWFFDNNKL